VIDIATLTLLSVRLSICLCETLRYGDNF